MTSTNKLFAAGIGIIISLLSVSVHAQSAGPESNHFAADELSFDYPAGYSLKDESTPEAYQLILTRKGSSVQLTLVVMRRAILQKDLAAALENFTEPMVTKVATTLAQGKNSPERTSFQTQVGPKHAEGIRLRSKGNGSRTGEVIWLRLKLRLVGLAFIRSEVEESIASQLWQTVTSSLRVEAPVLAVMKAGEETPENAKVTGSVLNGKALALPPPAYPPLARAAHASGTVTVQVLIDEEGNVSRARALDGHPLLQAVSVTAARQAKFSPTLLEGEPVKVAGVIKYNFVSQ